MGKINLNEDTTIEFKREFAVYLRGSYEKAVMGEIL